MLDIKRYTNTGGIVAVYIDMSPKIKKAICRWDIAASGSLPSCMRSCYKALYTVTNEMSDMAEKEHGLNPINHLRKAVCYLSLSHTHKFINLSLFFFL